jgi:hypothetical protein
MNDGSIVPTSDALVRRVAGAILLLVAIGALIVLPWLDSKASFPAIWILMAALPGGLGAAGVRLLIWPMGRPRS